MQQNALNLPIPLEKALSIGVLTVGSDSKVTLDGLIEQLRLVGDEIITSQSLKAILVIDLISRDTSNAHEKFASLFSPISQPIFYANMGCYTPYQLTTATTSQDLIGEIHFVFSSRTTNQLVQDSNKSHPEIDSIAVIGAGTMGTGIAICFLDHNIPVTLIDINQSAVERGVEAIKSIYQRQIKRGKLSQTEMQKRISLLNSSDNIEGAKNAGLIIEAVYENLQLKKSLFKELASAGKKTRILATNTSTFDIHELADQTQIKDRVIGLHFFSPAHVMPLVEVVKTRYTSPDVVCGAMNLIESLSKIPVLTNVCYGFIGNRMMEGYGREAELMALEGASPEKIDQALQKFGMAMGILAVFDMGGLDVGVKVHQENSHQLSSDPTYYQASKALYDAGRLGQKNAKGFYQYQTGSRSPLPDQQANNILAKKAVELGIDQRHNHSEEEIINRCLLAMINEGFNILEEGVAQRACDIDVVWTMGYGFPKSKGGPMFYANQIGIKKIYTDILELQKKFGDTHWRPAKLLQTMAQSDQSITDSNKC